MGARTESQAPTEAEILAQMEALEGQLVRLRDTLVADVAANSPELEPRRRGHRGGDHRA